MFHGTGTTAIKTGWKTGGTTKSLAKPFEGLLPQARRLYDASESEITEEKHRPPDARAGPAPPAPAGDCARKFSP